MDIWHSLILILVANAAPVFISFLVSHRASFPVDFCYRLPDQQRLFGSSKTWRGLFSACLITPLVSLLLGYSAVSGLLIALLAMSGDLFSSFIKRRLKKPSSSQFLLLDQIPESLLPALMCVFLYQFGLMQVILIVVIFIIMELALSFVLFRFGIRKRPY
ncbi:MAG: CDP-archaeol synthase [Gammaproteobacteria bacterium]|nr:CDP-archaeol synthase [Gammaproteobacteria bacterium]